MHERKCARILEGRKTKILLILSFVLCEIGFSVCQKNEYYFLISLWLYIAAHFQYLLKLKSSIRYTKRFDFFLLPLFFFLLFFFVVKIFKKE